jgi:hypothetical protein
MYEISYIIKCTSLRVGGVCEVVNRTGDIVVGCMRGGWGGFLSSFSNIIEYYIVRIEKHEKKEAKAVKGAKASYRVEETCY